MAIKVTSLTEQEISEIGEAFAYYNYAEGEYGMSALYKSKEDVKEYICGYARAMLKAGFLYSTSEEHEAFIAFKSSKESLGFGAVSELIKAVIRTMRFRDMIKLVKLAKKGGESYEDSLKKLKSRMYSWECWWFARNIRVRAICARCLISPMRRAKSSAARFSLIPMPP